METLELADNLEPYQVRQFCSNGLLSWFYLLLSLEYFWEVYQASGSQELVTNAQHHSKK